MKRYFELDPVHAILYAFQEELAAVQIPAVVHSDVNGYWLTFGEIGKYRVEIYGTSLTVTTIVVERQRVILQTPYLRLLFSTDLTVPDSVEKFMVVAHQLVGDKPHRAYHDLN